VVGGRRAGMCGRGPTRTRFNKLQQMGFVDNLAKFGSIEMTVRSQRSC